MRLSGLARGLGLEVLGDGDPEILDLSEDSREVGPGWLFAALSGARDDGRAFIPGARAAGAVALMAQGAAGDLPRHGLPAILVPGGDIRRVLSRAARLVHGKPDEGLLTIGLTGTNGKTTISYLLEDMLAGAGIPCGVIGTVDYRWGGRALPAPNTTPEGPLLWRTLRRMLDGGMRAVVMEVSSHALELGRLGELGFDAALFSNLSRDHLDFHPGLEEYYLAKRRLFLERLRPGARGAAACSDDPFGRRLLGELAGPGSPRSLGYGLGPGADVGARDLRLGRGGLEMTATLGRAPARVTSPLLGTFNAQNILGALAVAELIGVDFAGPAGEALCRSRGAPGRLERVGSNGDFLVLVDYAHTPGALAAALGSLRDLAPGRLVCLFGCGGDRDRGKRPLMAREAGRLADLVVLTSDNPRQEDPMAIIGDAEAGLGGLRARGDGRGPGTYLVEPDRGRAIRAACALMDEGDILLIAGKGHEDYQIVGTEKRHFDDREEALAALRGLGRA
ncbi:MAG: UDP-N-acetylmuramoyl-L-alanyl-D-glutamate--2,6-diaminopimelate ligase [Deltaproteobacteria bacterium]|jgi:UDP-N-acetylmuramoyl-L-alanyl-D-glutamate--2,6-diaminopimelate ligase|nr:UDP-N-acetylmuramoyl-L-alanyl-D-glutamate--2,6-diaminopimelate ligase [Deltaproteobacteria bacterium]